MKKWSAIIISLLVGAAVVFLVNTFIPEPTFDTDEEWLEYAELAYKPEIALRIYKQRKNEENRNIDHHYGYINALFRTYPYETTVDSTIGEYESMLSSGNPLERDIGHYGLGLIFSNQDDYWRAYDEYELVENPEMKYLNNSLGYVNRHIGDSIKAAEYFMKEIELDGYVSGAYFNLSWMYYEAEQYEELYEILNLEGASKHIDLGIQEYLYFHNGNIFKYYFVQFRKIWERLNLLGYLGALLIMGSWMMYLRKLDVFEPEDWTYILLALGLGMVFTFGVFILSDINRYILGFELNGELLNDFLYCVIGIGAIEELVKIIPLFILLRFTKEVNEPYDYILYGSLSALGFAFVENLIYIGENNLHIIHGRGLAAAVGHMFFTSIIAYGLMLNKYKRKWNPFLNFMIFFSLASFAHGFWDFWLINSTASRFSLLTLGLLFSGIFIWNSFKNNALNHSKFFDRNKIHDAKKLSQYLVYSLFAIIIFEYIAVSIKFGPDDGNTSLISSIFSGSYLIFFLSSNLGQFRPRKGRWVAIRFWGKNKSLVQFDLVESRIEMKRFSKDPLAWIFLPNVGTIERQFTVSNDPDWYMVKLDRIADTYEYKNDRVLIRTKEDNNMIRSGLNTFVGLYLIPYNVDTEFSVDKTQLKFVSWSVINLID